MPDDFIFLNAVRNPDTLGNERGLCVCSLYGNESQAINRTTPVERAIQAVFGREKNKINLRGGFSSEDFHLCLADYKSGSETAHNLLMDMIGVDFGTDFDAWGRWYDVNGWKTPEDWSLDCLEAGGVSVRGKKWNDFIPAMITALMHESPLVRMQAYRLLLYYTGRTIPYAAGGKTEGRLKSQGRWWKWWGKGGKTAHGAAAGPETAIPIEPRAGADLQEKAASAKHPIVPPGPRTHKIEKESVARVMNFLIVAPLVLLGVALLLGIAVSIYQVIKDRSFGFFIKEYGTIIFLGAAVTVIFGYFIIGPRLMSSRRFSGFVKLAGNLFLFLLVMMLLAMIAVIIYGIFKYVILAA
jgi:hypothetical protein